eukprot:4460414-Amphidinium_carterae.1
MVFPLSWVYGVRFVPERLELGGFDPGWHWERSQGPRACNELRRSPLIRHSKRLPRAAQLP